MWVLALSDRRYDRQPGLSEAERVAVGELAGQRTRWPPELSVALARLTEPIDDVLRIVTPQAPWWGRYPARSRAGRGDGRARRARSGAGIATGGCVLVRDAIRRLRQLVLAVAYLRVRAAGSAS